MERGISMIIHSSIIAVILYIIMVFIFKQNTAKAEDRSILLGAIVLIYMVLFGHSFPRHINRNIL